MYVQYVGGYEDTFEVNKLQVQHVKTELYQVSVFCMALL
jgi:hypothetical protein